MDQAGAEYLAALREARNGESNNDQEEVVEQTEQAESTEESQAETETDNENESEPKNEASQEDSSASEDEAVYYEIDGENVSYEQLKEWRSLSLKENDYTTKSQELEEEKERLKTTMESISGDRAKLQEQLIALQAMLDLDKLSDEQLKEMREFEPEKYIEYKEREQDRKKLIKEAKANSGPAVDVQGEQAKLIKKKSALVERR